MERRIFIKKGCLACMGLIGTAVIAESCGSALPLVKTSPVNKTLSVPVNSFSDKATLVIVRSSSLENDILLVKNQHEYKALYLRCTHEGLGLTATDKKIVCTAHGSIFDLQGNVVKEPALKPLRQFQTEVNNENVIIHLT